MDVRDYLIDHSRVDWTALLSDWAWLLPRELTVWLMNRFGDLFIVLDDGTIHLLDIGGGTFVKVADSRDDFCAKIDEGDNANQWLMIPLVDRLLDAGVVLKEGHCYGYRWPPILGGDYTVENTAVLPIREHYGFHASVHQPIKDFPDGSEVTIKFTNGHREGE